MHKKEHNQRKFTASLKGIQLDDEVEEKTSKTFDDIKRKALGINASGDDIVSLQGSFAQDAGFGVGMGLGYSRE
jgi:5,10-methylenetetrahydrofolate reductase